MAGSTLRTNQLLGSADGQTVLTMTGGGLDALIVEAIGLDIAESLAVLLTSAAQTEEDRVPIRCAIVNLQIDQGIATAQPIVIDTTDSKITVDGKINLGTETLDLFIQAFPKDVSPLSFNQPIHVDGRILSPSVNPAPGKTDNEVWVGCSRRWMPSCHSSMSAGGRQPLRQPACTGQGSRQGTATGAGRLSLPLTEAIASRPSRQPHGLRYLHIKLDHGAPQNHFGSGRRLQACPHQA